MMLATRFEECVRTGEVGVVDLSVSQSCVVEDLKLGLVCFCNVGKVLFVIGIHIFWVSFASLVSQMIPAPLVSPNLKK